MTTTNTLIYNIRKSNLLAKNLCIQCGKRPLRIGYQTCKICGDKLINRKRLAKLKRSTKIYDAMIDRGLITKQEAADILNVTPRTIENYLKKKWLRFKELALHKVFLMEKEVIDLKNKLKKRSNIYDGELRTRFLHVVDKLITTASKRLHAIL